MTFPKRDKHPDYILETKSVVLPPGSRVIQAVTALREILKKPRIQNIQFNADRSISWSWYRHRDEDSRNFSEIDIGDAAPSAILRLAPIEEFVTKQEHPAVVLVQLFQQGVRRGLYPKAIVLGEVSVLWSWYRLGTGVELDDGDEPYVLGVPVYRDKYFEDTMLFVCFGETPQEGLMDLSLVLKHTIPDVNNVGRLSTELTIT